MAKLVAAEAGMSPAKARRRQRMLEAAAKLFAEKGYGRTTFDEIAAGAGVGVATVYNHFGSKEGLVAAILRPTLEGVLEMGATVLGNPPDDPADGLAALMAAYAGYGGPGWAQREILRLTLFPGMGAPGSCGGPLDDFIRWGEAEVQAKIASLLGFYQDAGRVAAGLDISDATALIFAALNQHFGEYLANPGTAYAVVAANLVRRVRLLFDSWRG